MRKRSLLSRCPAYIKHYRIRLSVSLPFVHIDSNLYYNHFCNYFCERTRGHWLLVQVG